MQIKFSDSKKKVIESELGAHEYHECIMRIQ